MTREWIDDRHYKIKHIGEDGEFWVTYEVNTTKDAVYLTEGLEQQLAREFENGMGSIRAWENGYDEDGRIVYLEQPMGNVQVCRFEVQCKEDVVRFIYTTVNGEVIVRERDAE